MSKPLVEDIHSNRIRSTVWAELSGLKLSGISELRGLIQIEWPCSLRATLNAIVCLERAQHGFTPQLFRSRVVPGLRRPTILNIRAEILRYSAF